MLTNVENLYYHINMKLIQKLTQEKNKENHIKMLDECLLNQEAMPSKQTMPTEMKYHSEGEYIVKEDGVYLQYVVREEKSSDEAIKDDNNETNV